MCACGKGRRAAGRTAVLPKSHVLARIIVRPCLCPVVAQRLWSEFRQTRLDNDNDNDNDNHNDTLTEVPHPSNEGLALQARV